MKIGQIVKTKQGFVGYIVRRFILEGKIYCHIRLKNYEYRVIEEKDILEEK